MCTVVLLSRPGAAWPLLLAANRDERLDRAWQPPARHWPEQPDVLAGRDCSAGGTWLGINDRGLVAAVLNRTGTLGPAPGKASRRRHRTGQAGSGCWATAQARPRRR